MLEYIPLVSTLERWVVSGYRLITRHRKEQDSVATRSIHLFEAHGVHKNQIPRFINADLRIADLESHEKLLPNLTEEILDSACEKFSVRREWLDGASDQIYKLHDFYKEPESFVEFLETLLASNPNGISFGKVLVPESSGYQEPTLLVIDELIGFLGDREVYRHHICDNWIFSYWRSRAYLTACISQAWKRRIYLTGRILRNELLHKLTTGEFFIDWEGVEYRKSVVGRWHPEDMAVHPQRFLKGIDPETNNYGLKSGLELWLELDQQGLMATDLPHADVRSKFSMELANYR